VYEELMAGPTDATRPRPEIRTAFEKGALGIAICPAPEDVGESLTRIASFVWTLPDNDLVSRGNAGIYTDRYPKRIDSRSYSTDMESNVNPDVMKLFDRTGASPETTATYYTYAILCSGRYLDAFEPVLFRSADPTKPPRIPIIQDELVRFQVADLGVEIANAENVGIPFIDRRSKAEQTSLVVEWAAEGNELKLQTVNMDPQKETIELKGLDGEGFVRITGAPEMVLDLSISGHAVLDAWLRERKYSYLRRKLNQEDVDSLCELICRIDYQQSLIKQIDEFVDDILSETSATVDARSV